MKHLGTVQLETERLILRRLTINDAESVFNNWASDDEVTRFLSWPTHQDLQTSEKVLKDWIDNYPKNDFYQWAIVLKDLNEPVGTIGVVEKKDDCQIVEIGYCIGRQWWNKGITSEALNRLIKFFFEEVGVNKIKALHDTKNQNSGKVMAKCGMKCEGHLRQSGRNNTGIADHDTYGILADEYFKRDLDRPDEPKKK